jgi:hypothetical protein
VPERLIDRELAEAKRSLENLRAQIQRNSSVSFLGRLAGAVLGGKSKSHGELAVPYLTEMEGICAELTAIPSKPRDFKTIEEAIEIINQNILEQLAQMEDHRAEKQKLLGENPLIGELLQLQAISNPLGFEHLESLSERFRTLKIYKQALDSEALQSSRDELLPDFLRQAQKWDAIACKIEIRKRGDQLAKVEVDQLPAVNLLTTSNVALPQIFAANKDFFLTSSQTLKKSGRVQAARPMEVRVARMRLTPRFETVSRRLRS